MGQRRRVVFLSSIAAPLQVRFATTLNLRGVNDYTFLFCAVSSRDRGSHWYMDLPACCRVLSPVYLAKRERYLNPSIFAELRQLDPELLIYGGVKLPTVLMASAWCRARGRLQCLFSEPPRRRALPAWQAAALRVAYGQPNGVLAAGQTAARVFAGAFPGALIENVPYPADIDTNLTHPLRAPTERVRFLFSGRFIPGNNPAVVLEAFKLLRGRHPGIELLFSGGGPEAARLQAMCTPEELSSGAVTFSVGRTWEEVWEDYRSCHVLVMPRTFCGWGQVIPEAMASGMGIIAGEGMEAARDLIEDGVNGFLIERLDVASVADLMERYILHPEVVARHGLVNRRRAVEHRFESRAEQWDAFVERLFEHAGRSAGRSR